MAKNKRQSAELFQAVPTNILHALATEVGVTILMNRLYVQAKLIYNVVKLTQAVPYLSTENMLGVASVYTVKIGKTLLAEVIFDNIE